jgi:hypothetical protein
MTWHVDIGLYSFYGTTLSEALAKAQEKYIDTLELEKVDDCYCHIATPCGLCTDAKLVCSECGEEHE